MNSLDQYLTVRDQMRPGDVIAFGAGGFVSGAIKFLTRSVVSHVGVVFECEERPRPGERERRVLITESTTLNGKSGVQTNYLSERLADYPGRAWWLPLSDRSRFTLEVPAMREFLTGQAGEGYDYRGIAAFLARPIPGIGLLLHHGAVNAWFCSELIVAGFQKGGLLHGMEPDEVPPQRLCECSIYQPKYVQLIGKQQEIRKFNTL